MKEGVRHLIQCHCFLPQYRKMPDPIPHKFVVFSILENDVLQEKLAQCQNCGIIHKVTDVCKSEILTGNEENRALLSIRDIKLGLPKRVVEMLEAYNCDLPVWEHVSFIFSESKWGEKVKLSTDTTENETYSKFLKIMSYENYGVVVESGNIFIEDDQI
tara:strand:- start:664 stop:1140 length:477 start_codon:yes stop_codon:yes gene_type:complete